MAELEAVGYRRVWGTVVYGKEHIGSVKKDVECQVAAVVASFLTSVCLLSNQL